MTLLLLEFNPFREIGHQGCAPRSKSVVILCPVGNLAVRRAHDGRPMQRDGDSPFESAIEWLHQNCLKGPLRDHVIATEKNRVSLKHRLWAKFPGLLEEPRQALLVLKLQSNSVICEPKLIGKVAGRILDLAVC